MYTEENHWDCIATCFFIDCANNVVQFIETIYKILKPGGIWVNLGPLLYHFSDMPMEESIEPSYSEVRDVIRGLGFQIQVRVSTLLHTDIRVHACVYTHPVSVRTISERTDARQDSICPERQQYAAV